MNKNLNFNTQICTTIEQSNRLLELGLKPETADCYYSYEVEEHGENRFWEIIVSDWEPYWEITNNTIPAWSLHRLYKMCPGCLFKLHPALHKIVISDNIFYCTENNDVRLGQSFSQHCNLYNNIIDCIELLIKNNYFNKDYLK